MGGRGQGPPRERATATAEQGKALGNLRLGLA